LELVHVGQSLEAFLIINLAPTKFRNGIRVSCQAVCNQGVVTSQERSQRSAPTTWRRTRELCGRLHSLRIFYLSCSLQFLCSSKMFMPHLHQFSALKVSLRLPLWPASSDSECGMARMWTVELYLATPYDYHVELEIAGK
jgi:hypothetical protein